MPPDVRPKLILTFGSHLRTRKERRTGLGIQTRRQGAYCNCLSAALIIPIGYDTLAPLAHRPDSPVKVSVRLKAR